MKHTELPCRVELGSIYCTTEGAMCRNHDIVAADGELLATTKFKDVASIIANQFNAYGAMVEALRFYAQQANYEDGVPGNLVGTGPVEEEWQHDDGDIARAALAQLPSESEV